MGRVWETWFNTLLEVYLVAVVDTLGAINTWKIEETCHWSVFSNFSTQIKIMLKYTLCPWWSLCFNQIFFFLLVKAQTYLVGCKNSIPDFPLSPVPGLLNWTEILPRRSKSRFGMNRCCRWRGWARLWCSCSAGDSCCFAVTETPLAESKHRPRKRAREEARDL